MNQLCVLAVIILTAFESAEAASTEFWYQSDYDSSLTTTIPEPTNWGCSLDPNNEHFDWEPKGNPLIFNVQLTLDHMRDIPNSGGSYGMDIT